MASKFSCSLTYSDALKTKNTLLVYTDASDEYKVKYRSNVCRDLILSIEWTVPKQVLVTVKLYSKKFRKCFSSKGSVVNGCKTFMKLRGGFNVCSSPDYNILCLINIMPFVQFKECTEKCSASDNTLEKDKSLVAVGMLPLDTNKAIDNLEIEDKYFETIQTNNFRKPDRISEMLRNELLSNGTPPDGDKAIVSSQMYDYKVEMTEKVSVNTNSCVKFESVDSQHESCLLGDINATEIKSNIDNAIAMNSLVKFGKSVVIEEQDLSEKYNLVPYIEHLDMASIEALKVEKAAQETDFNPLMLNLPGISTNNQDTVFHVKTVCNDIENDYSNSLISDVSLNTRRVVEPKSAGISKNKNNRAVDTIMDIIDTEELNAVFKKKDESVEIKAKDFSTNECNALLNDVDGAVTDNVKINVDQTLDDEIDITMENELLDLAKDREIFMLSDVNEGKKSGIEMDFQMEFLSDKIHENKATIEVPSLGNKNIPLSDPNSVAKSVKVPNTNELLIAEGILNKSDSGIEIDTEDKFVIATHADSSKADNGIQNEPKLCISPKNKLDIKVDISPDNKRGILTSDSEYTCTSTKNSAAIIPNTTSTKDPLMNAILTMPSRDKCSSAKRKKDEDSEINNTHSNDIQLIESTSKITNKIPVSEFLMQCSSVSNRKLIAPKVTDNSTTNIAADKASQAVSNFFTAKANLVSETLIKKCSAESVSAKSSGTSKRGAVTRLSDPALPKDACAQIFPVMETKLKGLSMNMLDLLMSGNMSDAVISNGKKEVKVHKAILSSRSSVFKKIFTDLAEGSLENKVHVAVPNYIIEDLVVFMYAGLVNIRSEKMAHDLYRIAKRYCIKDLIDICSKYISK